jgi:hypothetical protein
MPSRGSVGSGSTRCGPTIRVSLISARHSQDLLGKRWRCTLREDRYSVPMRHPSPNPCDHAIPPPTRASTRYPYFPISLIPVYLNNLRDSLVGPYPHNRITPTGRKSFLISHSILTLDRRDRFASSCRRRSAQGTGQVGGRPGDSVYTDCVSLELFTVCGSVVCGGSVMPWI